MWSYNNVNSSSCVFLAAVYSWHFEFFSSKKSSCYSFFKMYTARFNPSLVLVCQHEEADNLPKQTGDTTDCALLQFILELGESYQYWRDEYPEGGFLREYVSYKADATGHNKKEYAATAVRLHHGTGGNRVYCIGDVNCIIEKCDYIVEETGLNFQFCLHYILYIYHVYFVWLTCLDFKNEPLQSQSVINTQLLLT